MSNLAVIAIVSACVRAFHNGSEFVTRLQARDSPNGRQVGQPTFTPKELVLAELLEESMTEGGQAVSNHFKAEQKAMGTQSHLLQQGDDKAKQELLYIAVTLQDEILDKLGHEGERTQSIADDLKSLHQTAIAKRHEAVRSISELRQRLLANLPQPGSSRHELNRQGSAESMAASFVTDAVDFSRRSGKQKSRGSVNSLETIKHDRLIPEIRADDIDALTIHESVYDDDRFTIAPEKPYQSATVALPSPHAPQPLYFNRFSFSSAASMRAADAPESMQAPAQPMAPLESIGPYFPPRSSAEGHSDHNLPTLPKPRRDRPSVPESHPGRSDSMPWATRIFSNLSAPSPSSSPRISEPDSAISFKMHSTKPYCNGAVAAQEDFIAGFLRNFLPVLPGSERRELCWKCKECDFNALDPEGQLFERIEFKTGVRYRFKFLARCHVPYTQPKESLKPRYYYGCLFCTAEGKQSATWTSVDALMTHISNKHQTNLTPEVKDKTRCVVGKLAGRDEDWDCNFPDVTIKKGTVRNFVIRAVTSLPT